MLAPSLNSIRDGPPFIGKLPQATYVPRRAKSGVKLSASMKALEQTKNNQG